jgi:hypothetical protein
VEAAKHAHGSIHRENSPWGAPMEEVILSSDERSAAISGRAKVSLWLKFNPIWWFFNDAGYSPNE